MKDFVCKMCGGSFHDTPAVSRSTREEVCPDCGLLEALYLSGLSDDACLIVAAMARKTRRPLELGPDFASGSDPEKK